MNIDWNTFFSSFSQSAAAIIGIIAAFLISKILGENDKLENQIDVIDRLIIKNRHIKSKIEIRRFEWYDKRNIEYDFALEKAIKDEDFKELTPQEKLDKLFEILPDLYQTKACLPELEKRIKEMEPSYISFPGGSTIKQEKFGIPIVPNGLWSKLSAEREAISQLEIESHTLISKFKRAEKALAGTRKNIIPLRNAIYLQSTAFLITVVYPLHFMPMGADEEPKLGFAPTVIAETLFSFKGFFLILLCIVILSVFGYFLFVIVKLLRSYDAVESSLLPEYTDIKKYSEYFRNNLT